jgi:hypothetical protein
MTRPRFGAGKTLEFPVFFWAESRARLESQIFSKQGRIS